MTQFFCSVAGMPCSKLRLHVPARGAWIVDAPLTDDHEVTGRVEVRIGDLVLCGTVDPTASGAWESTRKVRVVGGANGWWRPVLARAYHSDYPLLARTVASDAASEVGEVLGGFVPAAERVGIDWVRRAGPASETLERAIGGVPWWVDYSGVTQVGARPEVAVGTDAYRLLTFDSESRIATLMVDEPTAVVVGAVLSDRLPTPQVVRELRLTLTGEAMVCEAWCGGEAVSPSRLARGLEAIARHATRGRLWGSYRYRVTRMVGDRAELEPVRGDLGLPKVGPLSQWTGVPGGWAQLAEGHEVVVSFLDDGDPAYPVIVGFAPKGREPFVATRLELGCPVAGGAPAARLGDAVSVYWPPLVTFEGTIGGLPAAGALVLGLTPAPGVIVTGSGDVSIGRPGA